MRFSLRLGNHLTGRECAALTQAAEAAGFDQVWVSHDLFGRSTPVMLAEMAQATRRIEIGVAALNPYTLHPAELAMLAATLDELSGNRFNLGLAAGAAEFLKWVGLEHGQPLARVREAMATVRSLWRGEGGPGGWSQEAYLRFKAPRVTPIYLAATGPRMLALAGEAAEGALPLCFPPEQWEDHRAHAAQGLVRREAGLGEFDLAACIWVSLSDDGQAARLALARTVAFYGSALSPNSLQRAGLAPEDFAAIHQALNVERDEAQAIGLVDERMLRLGIAGRADEVIARLEPLIAAGLRHVSFGSPLGPDRLEAIGLLGRVARALGGRA